MNNQSVDTQLIEMTGIQKSFPGVQALSSAAIDLYAGEIHALVGENGAGKSTLIKILTGVHQPDEGEIKLKRQLKTFRNPLEAQQAGIATIYQEFTLVPSLSVAANIFLGHEKSSRGFINHNSERSKAQELLGRLGVNFDVDLLISELTVAQQQMVEIARALAREASVLVMDEPTASLAPSEVKHLFDVLHELTQQGIGIIFISHRLEEVFMIADRITVIRDGVTIDTHSSKKITRRQLVVKMVGRSIDQEYPKTKIEHGDRCFEVNQLSGGPVNNISFTASSGEILGLAGLMGAGRTEIVRLIYGADPKDSGDIMLHGKTHDISSPHDAINSGISLLTEDRKLHGLVLRASAKDNFALPNLLSWSRYGWIDRAAEQKRFEYQKESLNIRLAHSRQRAEELSGGNQQKLLVARWIEKNSKVIIFDEPTRGIDVGAKYEMYLLMGKLAAQGKVIIMISSELPELLGICDRILVIRRGEISGEIRDVKNSSQEDIMTLAI